MKHCLNVSANKYFNNQRNLQMEPILIWYKFCFRDANFYVEQNQTDFDELREQKSITAKQKELVKWKNELLISRQTS
jgi:DNA polymerase III alpha subunit